jgi:hypothetical protein
MDYMQESFNGGEISPQILGQIELGKYITGAAKMLNFVCLPHGPAQNRSGTRFIAEIKDSSKYARLIPFQYSIDEVSMLEVGDNYIRVYQDGARLETQQLIINGNMEEDGHWWDLGSPSAPSARVSDWTINGTYSRSISPTAGGDGITTSPDTDHGFSIISGFDYSGIVWVRPIDSGGAGGRSFNIKIYDGATVHYNTNHTGLSDNAWHKLTFSFTAAATTTKTRMEITVNAAVPTYVRVDNVSLTKDGVLEVPTSFDYEDVSAIDYAQSADNIYFAHPDYLHRVLSRYDSNAWFFNYVDFAISIRSPEYSWTASGSGTNEYYLRTSDSLDPLIDEPFGVSLGYLPPTVPAVIAAIGTYAGRKPYARGVIGSLAVEEWDYGDNDTLGYSTIYVRAASGVDPDTLAKDSLWANLLPAEFWTTATGQQGFPSGTIYTQHEHGASSVVFHNDRLIWSAGEKMLASKSSVYVDHTISESVADDDALNLRLGDGQVSTILFLRSLNQLVAMTPSNEWIISGADGSSVITSNSKRAKIGSSAGSEQVRPVMLNNSIIQAMRHARVVKELIYDYNSDSFVGFELSDFALHLTRNYAITEMAFQRTPYKILWCVRSDGELLGLTYYPQQKVFGWHRHEISGDGKVESVAVIPGSGHDELWMVVKRDLQIFSEIDIIDNSEDVAGVWADGSYIFSANKTDGARVYTFDGVNISNVSQVVPAGECLDIMGDGTYVYIACGSGGMWAMEFSGGTLTPVDQFYTSYGGSGTVSRGVWCDGTYIYLANGLDGIRVLSFDGANLTAIDNIGYDPDEARSIWGDGTYIFLAVSSYIIAYTFDGSDLTVAGAYVLASGSAYDIWGDGDYIYVAAYDAGLMAFSFDADNGFTLLDTFAPGTMTSVSVTGNKDYIYLSNESGSSYKVEFDGESISLTGEYSPGGTVSAAWPEYNYLYIANGTAGLAVWGYSTETKRRIEILNPFFVRPDKCEYFLDDDTTDAKFLDSSETIDNRVDIVSMSHSNPCVVETDSAHGWSNGDTIKIRSVIGMLDESSDPALSGVNGISFTVANKTSTTAELQYGGADFSSLELTNYISGGTAAKEFTAVTGADHLENELIAVVADGAFVGYKTVLGGGFTLDDKASVVHYGYRYDSDLQTLPPRISDKSNTLQAVTKRIAALTVRCHETDGLKVSNPKGGDTFIDIEYTRDDPPTGHPDYLFDGDSKEISFDGEFSTTPSVLIRQSDPLPATISAIIYQIEL